MATETETISYRYTGDSANLVSAVGKAEKASGGLTSKLGSFVGVAAKAIAATAAIGVAAGAVAYKFVDMASDLDESKNVVNEVFGEQSKTIEEWSKNSIKAMGLSQTEALKTVGTFGALGKSLEVPGFEDMSTNLTQLSADLASFYNISQEQASGALKGIYTGESEALKSLGIIVNDNTLNASKYAQEIGKTTSEMTEAEKVQARYSVVMEATASAQGDFSRTSGGFANQQRIVKEQLKQLGTELGAKLLPLFEKVAGFIINVLDGALALLGGDAENTSGSFDTLGGVFDTFIGIATSLWESLKPLITALYEFGSAVFDLGKTILDVIFGNQVFIDTVVSTFETIFAVISMVLTDVITFITGVVTIITDLWAKYGDYILVIWTIIVQAVKSAAELIGAIWETIVTVLQMFWEQFGDEILAVINFIIPIVIGIFITLYGIVLGVIEGLKLAWQIFGPIIIKVFQIAFSRIQAIIDIFKGIFMAITSALKGDWSGMVQGLKNAFNGFVDFVTAPFDAIWKFIKGILDKIKNLWDSTIGGIVDGAQGVADFFGFGSGGNQSSLNSTSNTLNSLIGGAIPQGGTSVYSSGFGANRAARTTNNNFTIQTQNTMSFRDAVRQKNFHLRTQKIK